GIGWTGANAYMFSALVYTAYYPSVVGFSLVLLALYYQLLYLRTGRIRFFALEILAGGFAFVNHPPTGLFFFICSGLLFVERGGSVKKTFACYSASVAAALVLMAVWPYYDFFSSLVTVSSGEMGKTWDYQETRRYLYSMPFLRVGPALAAIPFVVLCLVRKRFLMLGLGWLLCSLIYISGYFLHINLAERFIFFSMFFLQVAASRISIELKNNIAPGSGANFQSISAKFFALFLICGVLIQAALVAKEYVVPALSRTSAFPFFVYKSPNAMQRSLGSSLSAGDVVLSDVPTSWAIPVYTGAKIIVLFHTPPHVINNARRIKDVVDFYSLSTNNVERRRILDKYGVTRVVLNFKVGDSRALEPVLHEMGLPLLVRKEDFCIFSVPHNFFKHLTKHTTWNYHLTAA
ncbi:MAG: hypothetical protein WCQ99_17235, partial [Pseudomonadota bacterium]